MGWAFIELHRIPLFSLVYFLNELPYTENSAASCVSCAKDKKTSQTNGIFPAEKQLT